MHAAFQYKVWASPVLLEDAISDAQIIHQTVIPAFESESFIEYPSNMDDILGMESIDIHMPLQTQLPADLESSEFIWYTQTSASITSTGEVPVIDSNNFQMVSIQLEDDETSVLTNYISYDAILGVGAAVAPFDPKYFDTVQPFQEQEEDELQDISNLIINNHLDLGTGLLVISTYDYDRKHMVELVIDKDSLNIVGYSTTKKPVWKERIK